MSESQTPLVSVIIPIYNREDLVGETLDSVVAQTYQNWECIVVDDGSTDRTREVVQSYCDKDRRIKLFNRPTDRPKGANACRNYGFEQSKGEFINWFDSDDLMHRTKLSIQTEALNRNSDDLSFHVCQTEMFDEAGGQLIGLRSDGVDALDRFNEFVQKRIFWLTSAPLWRKCFLNGMPMLFDEQLHQCQDFEFHVRVLSSGTSYIPCDQALVIARIHTGAISASRTDSFEKFKSNLDTYIGILQSYSAMLSSESQADLRKWLVEFFKLSIKNKKLLLSCYWIGVVLIRPRTLSRSFLKNLQIAMVAVLAVSGSVCFGRGERFISYMRRRIEA